jgi:hypothetical protein
MRDSGAYRLALGVLGLALTALLIGIAWVATVHDSVEIFVAKDPSHVRPETRIMFEAGHIPVELWFAAAALGGLFAGILIPFSAHVRSPCSSGTEELSRWARPAILIALFLAIAGTTLPAFGFADDFLSPCVLAVTIAAGLLGLLIPSPAERVGRGGI